MAANIKVPAIFLAQFAGDAAPFNSLPAIAKWAAATATRASRCRPGTGGAHHNIQVTEKVFDDFAGAGVDKA